jgi:hypothetical protein
MNILFDKADVTEMSPITQDLYNVLKKNGYSLLECGRRQNNPAPVGASFTVTAKYINRLEFISGDGDCVIITTCEPFSKKEPA